MTALTARQSIAFLASLMRESRQGQPSRGVLFLGAGASVAAGVPLADELKQQVAGAVFGASVPDGLVHGRLEDAMELFQKLGECRRLRIGSKSTATLHQASALS